MESEPRPETLVANIAERLKAGVWVIRVWGADVVRPSDQTFAVKSASFDNDRLCVVLFLALDGEEYLIDVERPTGAKVTAGALRIRDAARVTVFGGVYLPPSQQAGPALYLGI
jgi:hypothetical protein